ncbi:hypothetical protein, partial [Algiphilus sp.]|uniref:hypothetical protein n=1 Tax=Algiphilus sp. TaxID=1872431 RepID=UPI003C624C0C
MHEYHGGRRGLLLRAGAEPRWRGPAAPLPTAALEAAELRSGLGARDEYNESLLTGVGDEADEAIYAAAAE